jgi:O-acetylserine/cysteine efflux transporter
VDERVRRAEVRLAGLATVIAVVWGLCFVLIQASLPNAAPLLLAGNRALIGGAILAAAALLRATRTSRRGEAWLGPAPETASATPRRSLPSLGLVVALALSNAGLAFGAMYLAANRAEAAVASVLAGGQPLLLAAAGWLWFGERGSRRSVVGLALGLGGVVLAASAASGATTQEGLALALLAAAAPAAGTLLMRRLAGSVDLLVTTAVQFLLGGMILVALSGLLEPWSEVRWPAVGPSLLVLGVLGTGLAYLGWFWLLGRLSLVRLGAALFLVPVVGVAVAVALGDRPSPVELAGMTLAMAGVGLVAIDPAARTPTAGTD